MSETETSDEKLSDLLGIDRTTISRLRRGLRRPSLPLAEEIAKATDFKVLPNDFSILPEVQEQAPRPAPTAQRAETEAA